MCDLHVKNCSHVRLTAHMSFCSQKGLNKPIYQPFKLCVESEFSGSVNWIFANGVIQAKNADRDQVIGHKQCYILELSYSIINMYICFYTLP